MQPTSAYSEAVFHKHSFKELVLNVERVIRKHYQLSKTEDYIHRKNKVAKRALNVFMDQFNPDFRSDPIEVLKSDAFEDQLELYFSETLAHLDIELRYLYRGILRFVNDEVVVLHGTNYWVKDDFGFDQNADATTRFKLCVDNIYTLYEKGYKKYKDEKKYKLVATAVNSYCKAEYLNANFLRKAYSGYRPLPLFADIDEKPDFFNKKKYSPYAIIRALEKISLAPEGYLTSVIHPILVSDIPKRTKSKFPRKPNFDFSLITERLKSEIHLYAKYKTDIFTDKKRNGSWKVRPSKKKASANILTSTCVTHLTVLYENKYIPSLGVFNGNLMTLIRYAVESKKITDPNDITLFNLIKPSLIQSLINSAIIEGKPIVQTYVRLITTFSCMWKPESCFFSEHRTELGLDLSEEELLKMAEEYYPLFDLLRQTTESLTTLSPNSTKIKNKFITDLTDPSEYVRKALSKAKNVLAAHDSYRSELKDAEKSEHPTAVLSRNITIISCLLELPLRARNWSDMRLGYTPDGECIYKNQNGLYEVHIPKHCFKNFDQKIIPENFVHVFSKSTSAVIAAYLDKDRESFKGSEDSPYFMVSTRSPYLTVKSLSRVIDEFFKMYGDQTIKKGGIRIHFFRDIVATSFLKQFPGAYAHAGMLLLDSEETMKENYGHLQPKDALSLWQIHNENKILEGA